MNGHENWIYYFIRQNFYHLLCGADLLSVLVHASTLIKRYAAFHDRPQSAVRSELLYICVGQIGHLPRGREKSGAPGEKASRSEPPTSPTLSLTETLTD